MENRKGRLYKYFKEKNIKLIDLRARDIQEFINYLYKANLKMYIASEI